MTSQDWLLRRQNLPADPNGSGRTPAPLIVHVIHQLRMGGLENGVVNLINRTPSDRYRHCVLCVEDYSDFRNRITRPDVDVIALHRSNLGTLGLYRRIHAILQRKRPAILHSRNLSGLDALLPAYLAGVPCRIHGEHGWDVGDLKGENQRPRLLRRLHAPLVHRYVAVSKDLERYLVDGVGIDAARITHIYNGVDTSRFAPAVKPQGMMPAGFEGEDKFVIGTVGRLNPIKDQATLILAVARVVGSHPMLRGKVRLAIVGDGPLKASLASCAAESGISDFLWLPGARDDTDRIYRCFDVFALPSLNEGISNTLLEAMASGLPVVATAVGGNRELVQDGVTGRLVPPGSVEALAGALTEYIFDSGKGAGHGAASRRRVLESFSIDTMVAAYLRTYDEVRARTS